MNIIQWLGPSSVLDRGRQPRRPLADIQNIAVAGPVGEDGIYLAGKRLAEFSISI